MDKPKLIIISWDEFKQDCIKLAAKVTGRPLLGVPGHRGSQIVAAVMAHSPYGNVLVREWREGAQAAQSRDTVIVDDIAETGATLARFRVFITAAVYVRESCYTNLDIRPDYVVRIIRPSEYILFPWEDKEYVTKRLMEQVKFQGV